MFPDSGAHPMSFYTHRRSVQSFKSDSKLASGHYFNFDLISIASSNSGDHSDDYDVPGKASPMLREAPGRSFETITESVFSNTGLLDDYYEDTTETESFPNSKGTPDALSERYSMILDLLVDYDDVALIISGQTLPSKIARSSLHPTIDAVLGPPKPNPRDIQPPKTPQAIKEAFLPPPSAASLSNLSAFSSHGSSTFRQPDISKLSSLSNIHSLPLSLAQPSIYPPLLVCRDDYTVVATHEPLEPRRKGLKYKVVVTRNSLVENVRRLSKSWGRKTDDSGNKLFLAIKLVIRKSSSNDTSDRRRATVPVFAYTGKNVFLNKLNSNAKSMTLTRLSGFHEHQKEAPRPVQPHKTHLMPLPRILDHPIQQVGKDSIAIKKQLMLIRDESTNLYNLYALGNPYLSPNEENQRLLMVMLGIKLDPVNLDSKRNKKRISLSQNQTLVKNSNSNTYTISYDLVQLPVLERPKKNFPPAKGTHQRPRPHTAGNRVHRGPQKQSHPSKGPHGSHNGPRSGSRGYKGPRNQKSPNNSSKHRKAAYNANLPRSGVPAYKALRMRTHNKAIKPETKTILPGNVVMNNAFLSRRFFYA